MKILLINPTDGPESDYGTLAKAATELPQLGLASVAAALRAKEHDVTIIDAHVHGLSPDGLVDRLRHDSTEMVGFSTYITTQRQTLRYAEHVKTHCPGVHVVVGGPHVTLAPHYFRSQFIDYVFIGEADESLVELVAALEDGAPLRPIQGVIANAVSDGKTPQLRLVSDLDALPLVQLDEFYPLDRYYPSIDIRGQNVINVISTRGCPYECTFCAVAEVNGRKMRSLSPSRFVDNFEYYVKKGIKSFLVYDDTFTINKKRAIAICKEIIARRLNIEWKCWTRVDCLSDEVLGYLRDAGCYSIMFGCETFNEKTLTLLCKGFTVEQNYRGIEMVHRAGFITSSSFMIGLPNETEMDIRNTISCILTTELDIAYFPIFEPYEGTPIYDLCRKTGSWVVGEQYKNSLLKDQEEVWVPHSCDRKLLVRLASDAHRAFYFRPKIVSRIGKMMLRAPMERKVRILWSAADYFVFRPFRDKSNGFGSRYH